MRPKWGPLELAEWETQRKRHPFFGGLSCLTSCRETPLVTTGHAAGSIETTSVMAGTTGLEPATSCVTGSLIRAISLILQRGWQQQVTGKHARNAQVGLILDSFKIHAAPRHGGEPSCSWCRHQSAIPSYQDDQVDSLISGSGNMCVASRPVRSAGRHNGATKCGNRRAIKLAEPSVRLRL